MRGWVERNTYKGNKVIDCVPFPSLQFRSVLFTIRKNGGTMLPIVLAAIPILNR